MTHKNPEVNRGDKILLVVSRNGNSPQWEGIELEVVTNYRSSGYITARSVSGMPSRGTISLYSVNTQDEYVLYDRKERANWLSKSLVTMKNEIKRMEEEIKHLTKYSSEEEYTAYKIERLFSAKGVKAKAEILKELRKTNYI